MTTHNFHLVPAPPDEVTAPLRVTRLPAFVGLACDPTPRLDRLGIAVVGTGSVGRRMALHLARLQPRALWLVDHGRYKPESLLTQPITPDEVGLPKATATARVCSRLSPRTRVYAFDGRLSALDETALADADLLLGATDNLHAEVTLGELARRLGRPLLLCSVHGETLTAQCRVFGNQGDGPCPACAFGQVDWSRLNAEVRYSCEGFAAGAPGDPAATVTTRPTASLAALCSLAADLGVLQTVRHVLGLGRPVTDTQVEHNAYTHRTVVSPLKSNDACPCEHRRWSLASLPRPLADCSMADLLAEANFGLEDPRHVTVAVAGHAWVSQGSCPGCGHHGRVDRFLPDGSAGPCPACGTGMAPHPLYRYPAVPLGVLHGRLASSLARLGADTAGWAVLRGQDRGVLLRPSPTEGSDS